MRPRLEKVIFTGGRDYNDFQKVKDVIKTLGITFAVVGDCPTGLDSFVREIMEGRCDVYKADWDRWGKPAGPIRNREMIEKTLHAPLIAFRGDRGTADCIRAAQTRGRLVFKVL